MLEDAADKTTLATSEASLQAQVALVNEFATNNFLQLNLIARLSS